MPTRTVFAVLDEVNETAVDSRGESIEGQIGKRLYKLAQDVLAGDVDVDLRWTRPTGRCQGRASLAGRHAHCGFY